LPNGRIVFDHLSDPKFRVFATFEERAAGVAVTLRMQFDSIAVCESVKGIVVGANEENFDRLAIELGIGK